jgi:hypothetical protein
MMLEGISGTQVWEEAEHDIDDAIATSHTTIRDDVSAG